MDVVLLEPLALRVVSVGANHCPAVVGDVPLGGAEGSARGTVGGELGVEPGVHPAGAVGFVAIPVPAVAGFDGASGAVVAGATEVGTAEVDTAEVGTAEAGTGAVGTTGGGGGAADIEVGGAISVVSPGDGTTGPPGPMMSVGSAVEAGGIPTGGGGGRGAEPGGSTGRGSVSPPPKPVGIGRVGSVSGFGVVSSPMVVSFKITHPVYYRIEVVGCRVNGSCAEIVVASALTIVARSSRQLQHKSSALAHI